MHAQRHVSCLLVVGACVMAGIAGAGTFEGLEPGVSTKAEADAVLGPPIREVVAGIRYDYDPSSYDARRISIQFDRQTSTIVKIDLHLDGSYGKSDYRGWFELAAPSSTTSDDDGNLVERYLPQGISLHFSGADDSSPVAFFRHFDPGSQSGAISTQGSGPPTSGLPGQVHKPFFGSSFMTDHQGQGVRIREVHPNSPAERAGLRPGDVILEFGEHTFYGSTADPWEFVALTGSALTGIPIRLVVERGTSRTELQITLELRDQKEIEEERRQIAFESYRQGESLYRQGEYARAIPLLERAYVYNQNDARNLELLGYCRFREKRYREAIRAFYTVLQRTPESASPKYFIGACFDALGNSEKAVEYYQQYLASDDSDRKKQKYAQRRVKTLTGPPQQQTDWSEVMSEVISAIQEEMDDD